MITRIIKTKGAVKVGKRGLVTQTWPLPTASPRAPFTDDIIQTKSKS
jgi:2',3'-cyclic-nucleotide 2'-phosphodiesterase (5'-nucleotidase family)